MPTTCPELLRWADRLGFDGLDVTHPFKQAVMTSRRRALRGRRRPRCRQHGQSSGTAAASATTPTGPATPRRSGRRCPRRVGDRRSWSVPAGPGWRWGTALLRHGAAHLGVVDEDGERAAASASSDWRSGSAPTGSASRPTWRPRSTTAGGLVNATPVGMDGHPGTAGLPRARAQRTCGWPTSSTSRSRPSSSHSARARGCRVMTGGGMAVHQASGAFELFTGRTPTPSGCPALRGAHRA